MQIFITVQLAETETIAKSAAKLASDILVFLGGDPAKDTSTAAITSTAHAPAPPP